ncbi:ykwD, partial [Symbiodinium sp. CCMP2456]
ENNYFSHYSQDGRSPWDRARAQGISANAENIAAGNSGATATLRQWQNSDGHCKNMMNSRHKLFGIGWAYDASSTYRHYWTQMLSSTSESADRSCYPSREAKFAPVSADFPEEEITMQVPLPPSWEYTPPSDHPELPPTWSIDG